MLNMTRTYIVKLDSNIYIKFRTVEIIERKSNSWSLTVWELRDGFVHVLETPKNISQAGCRPKILLFKAEFFPDCNFTFRDQL